MLRSRFVLALAILFLPLLPRLAAQQPMDFTPPSGKFTAKFLSKPMESEQKTPNGPMKVYLSLNGTNGQIVMVLENADLAKATGEIAEQALDKGKEGILGKGKLISEKKIKLDGKHPGRELLVELPNAQGFLRMRLYLAGPAMYVVMAVSPTQDGVKDKAANDFLDSFKVGK
jgi:hypothetical protein